MYIVNKDYGWRAMCNRKKPNWFFNQVHNFYVRQFLIILQLCRLLELLVVYNYTASFKSYLLFTDTRHLTCFNFIGTYICMLAHRLGIASHMNKKDRTDNFTLWVFETWQFIKGKGGYQQIESPEFYRYVSNSTPHSSWEHTSHLMVVLLYFRTTL